ncbi:transmembrane protein 53-like [Oratosquilla oratoria]|uniref:transmembrane protein 53-like n=1 Tax=Oratosquilla oratoria TaxID=337810 RepID=UPI003F75F52E
MHVTSLLSTLRNSTPTVSKCFRNAVLHRSDASAERRNELVVLYSWLAAKEKIAYKYVNSWTTIGYDVLHITTTVKDLLMPRTGTEVTADRTAEFLLESDHDSVIFHGLSVGGYVATRVLIAAGNDSDATSRITHGIYDSFTNTIGMTSGVETAVPPFLKGVARWSTSKYYQYANLDSFREAEEYINKTPFPVPTYYMHSLADRVARYEDTLPLIKAQARVSPISQYILPEDSKVPHVTILRYLGEEVYMKKILGFLAQHPVSKPQPEIALAQA